MKLFIGDEYPETCIRLYHDYLGGFGLPPFWAMGLHQSRWGYRDYLDLLAIVEEYKRAEIPFDGINYNITFISMVCYSVSS